MGTYSGLMTGIVVLGVGVWLGTVLDLSGGDEGDSPASSALPDSPPVGAALGPDVLDEADAPRLEEGSARVPVPAIAVASAPETDRDPEALEALVRESPVWTEDDSAFENRYRDFSTPDLLRADDVLSRVLHDESQVHVDLRLATGDFDVAPRRKDGTSGEFPPVENPPEDGRFYGRFMSGSDGGVEGTLRFLFPPEEYPSIDFRLRERNWVMRELHRRGHSFSDDS